MLPEADSRRRLTTTGHTHLHMFLVRCPDDKILAPTVMLKTRWPAGFLRDLPFLPPLHSCAAPHAPSFLIDVKSRPNIFTHSLTIKQCQNLTLRRLIGATLWLFVRPARRIMLLQGMWGIPESTIDLCKTRRTRIEKKNSLTKWDGGGLDDERVGSWFTHKTYCTYWFWGVFAAEARAGGILTCRAALTSWGHRIAHLSAGKRIPGPPMPSYQPHLPLPLRLWLRRIVSHLLIWGSGATVAGAPASHPSDPRSILGGFTPGFTHVGIVLDDAACRRVFSGISRFPRPCISMLLHMHLTSPSSNLKDSMLRAAKISPLFTLELTHLDHITSAPSGGDIPYAELSHKKSRFVPNLVRINLRLDSHIRQSSVRPAVIRQSFSPECRQNPVAHPSVDRKKVALRLVEDRVTDGRTDDWRMRRTIVSPASAKSAQDISTSSPTKRCPGYKLRTPRLTRADCRRPRTQQRPHDGRRPGRTLVVHAGHVAGCLSSRGWPIHDGAISPAAEKQVRLRGRTSALRDWSSPPAPSRQSGRSHGDDDSPPSAHLFPVPFHPHRPYFWGEHQHPSSTPQDPLLLRTVDNSDCIAACLPGGRGSAPPASKRHEHLMDSTATVQQVTCHFTAEPQRPVISHTTHNNLIAMGYKSHRPTSVILLISRHYAQRLKWARELPHWTIDAWKRVTWMDEST
ncbi:hypothetical protein PR048_015784 [Dryococelus australis]|uniref:Uncharacterized protein n=1 Tax=Dryococelus australis TaxID=614101 RepID=A0ABQ9HI77_9NEOP|nr:hypothetical protein PR048_015784 [Dryococelus australis]